MLTKRDLQELLDYKAQHPVLSAYLNTDPAQGSADVYKLKLRSMLKDADVQEEDARQVENYFDQEYDWTGRSVAVFSCKAEGFFRAHPIAVPIRSRVRADSFRPHVKPLAKLFDSYGYIGVALADQQGARLFSFHLGTLREQEGVLGDDIHRIKHGGGSQARGSRGREAQVAPPKEVRERNMREAAEFAANFFSEHNIRRVLIGGTDENIAQFRALLPKTWQSLIIGTFPISMSASHAEVLDKALEVSQKVERQREARIVEAVVTSASKGRDGVLNLDDTLGAVHEGRVKTLLVREGFRAPGYRCSGCGYISAQKQKECPFCGEKPEEIPDAVELAVQKVLRDGGDVDFIEEDKTLEEYGNIGALLRY
jgi:rRNA maturation endonuclease Nob1